MNTNSEQQDRFLEDLCACSEALSVLAERLEAEGRPWDARPSAGGWKPWIASLTSARRSGVWTVNLRPPSLAAFAYD